jgi:transcriptional regulator with PAS, ATPase and Fis domain
MITFLAPDEKILSTAQTALAQSHADIRIEQGLLSAGVEKARELINDGTEIIISRGGTAKAIKETFPDIIVVELPITGFDILRTVHQARRLGRRVGVVAFASMILGIECLPPILDVELCQYLIENEFEAEAKVLQAFRDGAEVIVGGVITGHEARKHNLPHVLIESGAEGILQSVLEAKRIYAARLAEKLKGTLFRTVLDYSYEGVVSINREQQIVICNPAASNISSIVQAEALGKPVSQVLPRLTLERLLLTGREELGQIIELPNSQILCNKIPILVNGKIAGAVATFQETGKIQQWEAAIRKKIYAGGHIASFTFADIIGSSPSIRDAISMAREFAVTDSSVLITGETGVGKEVFAQSIHNASSRAQKPFVAINCAALPAQILESELFGYMGGAFTGASPKGKAGLLEIAHGGTLFLDEIAEMDFSIQSKLLRVIQEKRVMRLGSDRVVPVDVRIIAATNKNLKTRIAEQQFRADLYYRLNVLRLRLPSLRERKQDIRLFAQYLLQRHEKKVPRKLQWDPDALERLVQHEWPGNVRELQNIVERIVALCKQETIPAELISRVMRDDDDLPETPAETVAGSAANERETIRQALAQTRGRLAATAKLLGISRSTLWRKMKLLDLSPHCR